jgi:HSP20 family molecular chaperone IbpA
MGILITAGVTKTLVMSQSSRDKINDERRRIFTERVFGTPGERAAYWATFATDFWEQAFDRVLPSPARKGDYPAPLLGGALMMRGVDIMEEGDNLVVEVDMPNFSKDKIRLRLNDNVLHVSATRDNVLDREDVDRVYLAARPSRFRKSIWLPAPVEQDAKVSAKYSDGVLRITIPIQSTGSIPIE